ncbi:cytochrome c oxidase subunit 3 [Saccharospirillum salsuginis]|uniref:Cytochrome-c oxidase n=1 Tax=Saccharospirillum salsuginis TaxID=418750 RepID=A0A918KC90_9GAMM|nr:cytochrome c oxidase subunit 3 [Saccharospirillum salsuginis]GGX58479.1 cytochrome-c oxidase [Saccharospirillum salsuginis]
MKWFGFLSDKPWLPIPAGSAPELTGPAQVPAPKIALGALLGVISVFFLLIFVTFITRSQYEDFQALAGEPWQPFSDTWRLWINTAVLLAASVFMHRAVQKVRQNPSEAPLGWLAGGALAAVLFLILQVSVWQFLMRLGYGVSANPANSYFYMLTGLHGLHLIGGLVALGRVFLQLSSDRSRRDITTAIEGCALYWHYLFILWLVLFFILTRTPDTYAFIAAACGLG